MNEAQYFQQFSGELDTTDFFIRHFPIPNLYQLCSKDITGQIIVWEGGTGITETHRYGQASSTLFRTPQEAWSQGPE